MTASYSDLGSGSRHAGAQSLWPASECLRREKIEYFIRSASLLPLDKEGGQLSPSAVERRFALPLVQMAAVFVPIVCPEFDVGGGHVLADRLAKIGVVLEIADSIEKVERQLLGAFDSMPFGIHVDVEAL